MVEANPSQAEAANYDTSDTTGVQIDDPNVYAASDQKDDLFTD